MKRPPKFVAAVKGEIIRELEAGGNLDTAANAAGLSRKTLASWLDYGEKVETEIDEGTFNTSVLKNEEDHLKCDLYDFLVATRKAKAKYLREIRAAAQGLVDPQDGQRPDGRVVLFLLQQTDAYKPKDTAPPSRTTVRIGGIQINRLPPPVVDRVKLPSADVIDVEVRRVDES